MVLTREMSSDGLEGTEWWTFWRSNRWTKIPSCDFFEEIIVLCMRETVKFFSWLVGIDMSVIV